MEKSNLNKDNSFISLVVLCVIGIVINCVLFSIVHTLHLPVYFDSFGTIVAGALGGPLSGMIVGFTTNTINSIHNPVSLYFGILSVGIGFFSSFFSKRELFKSLWGCLVAVLFFAIVGGALDACMIWMLSDDGIGACVNSPIANFFYGNGFPPFFAEFLANIIIDFIDKFITVLPVFLLLHFYPSKLYNAFPLSYIYDRNDEERQKHELQLHEKYRKRSLNARIIWFILLVIICVSTFSIGIGLHYYKTRLYQQYDKKVCSTAKLAALYIDGNKIDQYIERGRAAAGYTETEKNLYNVFNSIPELLFVYVYRFTESGNYVVFDLNTPAGNTDEPGALIPFDTTLEKYRDEMLSGKEIPHSIKSHDQYGWLCTGMCPIKDDAGRTQAYACVDISLFNYKRDILTYVIQIITILFGITILIATFTMWFAQKNFVNPINTIVGQTRNFYKVGPANWLTSKEWEERTPIHTGDEYEELYNTICSVETNISNNVAYIKETEWKLHQSKEIEKKNEELALAVKRADEANAAKTMFLSNVSHDMRTPLNSVIGFTKIAKEAVTASDKDTYLEKIGQSAEYLLGLINDTLDLSRIENKKVKLIPKAFNGDKIISNVMNCNLPAAEKKGVHLIINDTVLNNKIIVADEMRLEEILNNIVGNSVKFTPEDGTITVTTECVSETDKTLCVKFTISDTGIGMSKEFIPHIFEPFAQEDPYKNKNFTGTGLGLSIVKSIVELMGGNIEVQSEPGKGTTTTVYVAVPKSDHESEAATADHIDIRILSGCRVLLCEDNPMNVELATMLLEKQGIHVETAENGRAGIMLFSNTTPHYFDAILMDIRMPVMDGITATKEIRLLDREDAKTIPIIAMTANAYDEDRENTRAAGMNAHLAKPIDPDALYETLAKEINNSKTIDFKRTLDDRLS